MKKSCFLFILLATANVLFAQNDEQRIRHSIKNSFPQLTEPEQVLLLECKYKPGKTWQYLVACINRLGGKPLTTLLFAERVHDSLLLLEPYFFNSVETYEHINIDKSRDNIEELFVTTAKDSGNLDERYTGIYSFKNGYVDTLIKFHSFEYKSLKAPYFTFQPGIVVEQEAICKLSDINGDGKIDILNRIHRKAYNKEPGSQKYTFDHQTDYAEYIYTKGKFVKSATTKSSVKTETEDK